MALSIMLTVMTLATINLQAQNDGSRGLFGLGKSSADNSFNNEESLMRVGDVSINDDGGGITNDDFGAPLGSGIAILLAAGAGYAIVRRKHSRRNTTLLLACVLLLGFTQCKKEEPITPDENGGVRITLTVDGNNNGSRVNVTPPHVTFEKDDQILVASNGHYVGTLTHDGSCFSGSITDPVEEQPLYFYFLGNKQGSITVGDEGCTVNISDQTSELPVISMAPFTKDYSSSVTSYSSRLHNKCSLMKFNVTTTSNSPICITGMNNKVTVNFATPTAEGNGFTYGKEGEGVIKMAGGSGSPAVKWAIVLPQDASPASRAYTADNAYIGTRPEMAAISADQFLESGFALTVNEAFNPYETPLTLEAITEGTIAITSPKSGMQYTLNGGAKTVVSTSITVAAGDKVAFYGNGTSIISYDGTNITGGTADCYVYGNIMSLVNETGFSAATILTGAQAFRQLFKDNNQLYNHAAKTLVLPATTLTKNCYYQMFYGCTNLSNVKCLAIDKSASNCTYFWLYNVAASGTFTKAALMSSWTSGFSEIPEGWTVKDE